MIDIKQLTRRLLANKRVAGVNFLPQKVSIEELRCLADREWFYRFRKDHPAWDGKTKGNPYEDAYAKFITEWNEATGDLADAHTFRRSRERVAKRPGCLTRYTRRVF